MIMYHIYLTQQSMSAVWKSSVLKMCSVYQRQEKRWITQCLPVNVLAMKALIVLITMILHTVKV